eukprot:403367442
MARRVSQEIVKETNQRVLQIGHQGLHVKCTPVRYPLTQEIEKSLDECRDALRYCEGFWKNRCMGISAPQVGEMSRFFIMCDRRYWYHPTKMYKNFVTFLNPEIIAYSEDKIELWEGCMSNNEEICLVERPKTIHARYTNIDGLETDIMLNGLVSRMYQHEVDHLDGITMESRATETFKLVDLEDEKLFEQFAKEQEHRILLY